MVKSVMNKIPNYDSYEIDLWHYSIKTRKTILSNLKNYTKLNKFYCNNCGLTELPELPDSLIYLDCSYNNLKKLPVLPNSLIYLNGNSNNLLELPNLPNELNYLYCYNNNLTELPNLPNSLISLICYNNNLIELPDLPNLLFKLFCYNNPLIYPNLEIETINKTNLKNKIIKRMKVLNRTLLLEHSARICLNPKRIERLLNTNEINFYDGSFDTLTI